MISQKFTLSLRQLFWARVHWKNQSIMLLIRYVGYVFAVVIQKAEHVNDFVEGAEEKAEEDD